MNDSETAPYGDPINQPFWDAATKENLVVQQCKSCQHFQFYGRPFCLSCQSMDIEWVKVSGEGTIYSQTTVAFNFDPNNKPPYSVAMVQLKEGPMMLTNIINGDANIGDVVKVIWKSRKNAPPLALFEKV